MSLYIDQSLQNEHRELVESMSLDDLKMARERINRSIRSRREGRIREIRDEVRQLAEALGTTPSELLGLPKKRRYKPLRATVAADPAPNITSMGVSSRPAAPFVNPENPNETWAGRGKRPNWLRAKLERGHSLDEFRVA